MTPPKGPAERAADRIWSRHATDLCHADRAINKEERAIIAELISAEYASIEQENKELKKHYHLKHLKQEKAEQENQRLREGLELARAQQAATAATRNRYLSELNKLGAL